MHATDDVGVGVAVRHRPDAREAEETRRGLGCAGALAEHALQSRFLNEDHRASALDAPPGKHARACLREGARGSLFLPG